MYACPYFECTMLHASAASLASFKGGINKCYKPIGFHIPQLTDDNYISDSIGLLSPQERSGHNYLKYGCRSQENDAIFLSICVYVPYAA